MMYAPIEVDMPLEKDYESLKTQHFESTLCFELMVQDINVGGH